ncbi:MAG: hypothetical protein KBC00_01940 [Candidatus Levybacteria bacterium]|nr:hypothetical protein [Candidatus Levybacteria bacterium]MBP9815085.1 hypothetical protein [Candidatus Levybacteria bacterium]
MPSKERDNSSEYNLTNRERVQQAQRRQIQDKKVDNLSTETSVSKKNRFAFQKDARIEGMKTLSEVTQFIREENTGISISDRTFYDKLQSMSSNGSLPQSDGTTSALRKILRRR